MSGTRPGRCSPHWENASRNTVPPPRRRPAGGDQRPPHGRRLRTASLLRGVPLAVEDRTDRAGTGDVETLSRAVVATVIANVDEETRAELAERLEEFDYDEIVPEN